MFLAKTLLLLSLVPLSAASPAPGSPARDPLKVVTTIPDLADVARAIGGDRVEVTSICRGRENLHRVAPRPSHLVALSKADVLVQLGLSAEATWLPALMMRARNRRIDPGQPGFVNVSEGWQAIDVPQSLSRLGGDLHPQGNPHMNLSPRAGRVFADRILDALVALDPGSRELYERRHSEYAEQLEAAAERWAAQGAELVARRVVVYHSEFDYLVRQYGMDLVGTIEPKPGVPPTPSHLVRLIETMREGEVPVVLTAVWSNNRHVAEVAEKTGARVVELPNQVGGVPGADTWIEMMDLIHARLREAYDLPSLPE